MKDKGYAIDSVLPEALFQQLQSVLREPLFWEEHGYPTDQFFSYSLPLPARDLPPPDTLLDAVAACLRGEAESLAGEECGSAEWWVHRRSGGADCGHQLHFDLDELSLRSGKLGHPAVSTVLYVDGISGAPTLVTDEDIAHRNMAQHALRCQPRPNRALLFKGSSCTV